MAEKKKIFVFGNPLVEKDSLALKAAKRLDGKVKGIEFEAVESLDDIKKKQDLYIMDVAFGIKKVQLIENLEKLETMQPVSAHDFDLAFELKMLKKIGKIGKVRVVAIPAEYDLNKAVEEVKKLIE